MTFTEEILREKRKVFELIEKLYDYMIFENQLSEKIEISHQEGNYYARLGIEPCFCYISVFENSVRVLLLQLCPVLSKYKYEWVISSSGNPLKAKNFLLKFLDVCYRKLLEYALLRI